MTWAFFWTVIVGSTLIFGLRALSLWLARNDFELGAQAERDGLALNPGWSSAMKQGWGASWRARRGLNDLADEIGKVKP
jgi:hypothetical protein